MAYPTKCYNVWTLEGNGTLEKAAASSKSSLQLTANS
jgi:hypothetical protein